jgi:hypothetical protein
LSAAAEHLCSRRKNFRKILRPVALLNLIKNHAFLKSDKITDTFHGHLLQLLTLAQFLQRKWSKNRRRQQSIQIDNILHYSALFFRGTFYVKEQSSNRTKANPVQA